MLENSAVTKVGSDDTRIFGGGGTEGAKCYSEGASGESFQLGGQMPFMPSPMLLQGVRTLGKVVVVLILTLTLHSPTKPNKGK